MSNLLDLQFWFDTTPLALSKPFETGFFILFSVFLLGGFILRIMRKNKTDKFERELLGRAATIALTLGVLGFFWLFFSFEQVQIFGMRVWFLVWALVLVIWGASLYRYATKRVPQLRLLEQSKAEANKYLPRSNRR